MGNSRDPRIEQRLGLQREVAIFRRGNQSSGQTLLEIRHPDHEVARRNPVLCHDRRESDSSLKLADQLAARAIAKGIVRRIEAGPLEVRRGDPQRFLKSFVD